MGKIPTELRNIIASNIRECRKKKYPGRGGSKKCAEKFGVSPQQWSPWERGKRTPDEDRLARIAEFFEVSVEFLRRDNSRPQPQIITPPVNPSRSEPPPYGRQHFTWSDVFPDAVELIHAIASKGLRVKVTLDPREKSILLDIAN
ncbi:MAG: helix-turn-helix transcriptional regulator [Planctomycetaceae bacterium]|nr:helix-turn-helix transcriptional regulator [Planctomycetaceae bacterium]